MLIRFKANNFLSLKDSEFDMITRKGYRQHTDHISKINSGVGVLKVASIYGSNGAGKSNLLKAIDYFRDIVQGHLDPEDTLMPYSKRFRLDKEYHNKPTSFHIEFYSEKKHYAYYLEIDKGIISKEDLTLIKKTSGELVRQPLFERIGSTPIRIDAKLSTEERNFVKMYEKKLLGESTPFLSVINEIVENKYFISAKSWFEKLMIITPSRLTFSVPIISSESDVRDFTNDLIERANTGVNELKLEEVPLDVFFSYDEEDKKKEIIERLNQCWENNEDELDDDQLYVIGTIFPKNGKINYATFSKKHKPVVLVLKSMHDKIPFDLEEESDGTNRLIDLAPTFFDLLYTDRVIFIDEIERSLHPMLVENVLKTFLTTPDTSSQLIFTTHESMLLNQTLFRQDEIWFAEKRANGETLYSPLSEFDERYDKDIRKGYLTGSYGAIPTIMSQF